MEERADLLNGLRFSCGEVGCDLPVKKWAVIYLWTSGLVGKKVCYSHCQSDQLQNCFKVIIAEISL